MRVARIPGGGVWVHVRACVRARVRVCVRVCVRACTRRLTCPLLPNVNNALQPTPQAPVSTTKLTRNLERKCMFAYM
jgi:hypothetical protein